MAYVNITALPTAPSRARPSTFAAEGDAFLAALATFVTEVNTSGSYIDGVGTAADTDAAAAASSASTAAGHATTALGHANDASDFADAAAASVASSVSAWSSGASYSVGTLVYSPVDYKTYRAITTHSGETTDPSSDGTNWLLQGGIAGLTASGAELNKLDGATVTTAEINYNDITTLGTTEASKTVTADANGVVTFDNGIVEEFTTVTSSSNAVTCNLRDGTNFVHTLTENTEFTFSNSAASGKVSMLTLKLIQDSSASGYTVTWPEDGSNNAIVDWAAGTAPTLSATADAVDYFVFLTHDGGSSWYGFTAGQAMATPS